MNCDMLIRINDRYNIIDLIDDSMDVDNGFVVNSVVIKYLYSKIGRR